MKILISDLAFNDLDGIKKYYLEQGAPEVGRAFVISIFSHIQTLSDYPDIGRVVPEFNELHIREIIHPPFRVVYLREKKLIQIIRVWRSDLLLQLPE